MSGWYSLKKDIYHCRICDAYIWNFDILCQSPDFLKTRYHYHFGSFLCVSFLCEFQPLTDFYKTKVIGTFDLSCKTLSNSFLFAVVFNVVRMMCKNDIIRIFLESLQFWICKILKLFFVRDFYPWFEFYLMKDETCL